MPRPAAPCRCCPSWAPLSLVLLSACGDDPAVPAVPPERTKTLAELSMEEREALCDWTAEQTYDDPRVHRASCTNAALGVALADPTLSCVELRDDCTRRRPAARLLPCFAEPDAVTGGCPQSLVGDHLDCIAEFRQDALDVYGQARCDDSTSYLSETLEQRVKRLQTEPGCAALRKSCPSFFGSP